MNKKALVISSKGLGDGLLMMIISHHLKCAGYHVTFCHSNLEEMKDWFPGIQFIKEPLDLSDDLSAYDIILAQNDNKEPFQKIRLFRKEKNLTQMGIFYVHYSKEKHGELFPLDRVFDPKKTVAENYALFAQDILKTPYSKSNGICIPQGLKHQKYIKRILIHPTCVTTEKKWSKKNFITLANQIISLGYQVSFLTGPKERPDWENVEQWGISLPNLPTLSDLAAYIYQSRALVGLDSGPGHLASCLNIPTLIIGGHPKLLNIWRPDFYGSTLILPPKWVPNIKFLRWQEKYWPFFIPVSRVKKAFVKMINI